MKTQLDAQNHSENFPQRKADEEEINGNMKYAKYLRMVRNAFKNKNIQNETKRKAFKVSSSTYTSQKIPQRIVMRF